MTSSNIIRQHSKVNRNERSLLHGHKSFVLWLTGLSGAGKSTLAFELERQLLQRQMRSYVLDGDNIRHGLCGDLGFSQQDRHENIRRVGEVCKLFVDSGAVVLASFISPFREDRQMVRRLLEPGDFLEIYVKCSLEECERRDPKGLYKKAREGRIPHFTGVDMDYEPPEQPELVIETDHEPVSASIDKMMQYLGWNDFLTQEL